tara:strand:+ start:43 stop:273 length:231 start_codon:yes stop_codon:yes gene_type:complete
MESSLWNIKQQIDVIKSSINEIDMRHYSDVTLEVNELIRQIEFAADEIEMEVNNTNHVEELKEQGEGDRPTNTPGA